MSESITAFDWPASGARSGTMVGTATAPAVILIHRILPHMKKLHSALKTKNKRHNTDNTHELFIRILLLQQFQTNQLWTMFIIRQHL